MTRFDQSVQNIQITLDLTTNCYLLCLPPKKRRGNAAKSFFSNTAYLKYFLQAQLRIHTNLLYCVTRRFVNINIQDVSLSLPDQLFLLITNWFFESFIEQIVFINLFFYSC